jgi:hypothetical protein
MLEIFKKLRAGPVSAVALRDALAALDTESISHIVEKREKSRREAILSGDVNAVRAAEAALLEARLEAERVEIARSELETQIAEATKREADEALAAVVKSATARRDVSRRRIVRDLAPALKLACEVLREIAEADAEIERANDALANAGRGDRIARTEAEGTVPLIGLNYPLDYPLTTNITIRPVAEWGVSGWRWQTPAAPIIGFAPGMFANGRHP